MSKIDDLIKELCPDGVRFVRVGDMAVIGTGRSDRKDAVENGQYPFYVRSKIVSRIDRYSFDEEAIIIPGEGGVGDIFHYANGKYNLHQRAYRIVFIANEVNTKYALYYFMSLFKSFITRKAVNATVTSIRKPMIEDFRIPVPPLEVQKEIVRVLDLFTELEARKKQYEYYRNTLLTFEDDKNITWVELGEVAKYEQPTKYIVRSSDYNDSFSIPVLTAGKTFILGYTDESSGIYNASVHPVIIFDDFTTANKWVDFDFKVKSSAMKIITSVDEGTTLLKYIYHWLNTLPSGLVEGDHKRQWISSWSKKKIPIPSLEKQKKIVSILDKFEKLTNDISIGLPAEIEARRKQYEYYRNKLLTFKELECSR